MSDRSNDLPARNVGYKCPPVATQFKKGKSGNPKGRTKGKKGFSTLLRQELERLVTITQEGKQKKITLGEVAAKKLVGNLARGDHKALSAFIAFERLCPGTLRDVESAETVNDPADLKVLQNLLASYREEAIDD